MTSRRSGPRIRVEHWITAAVGTSVLFLVGCAYDETVPATLQAGEHAASGAVPTFRAADCAFPIAADLDIICGYINVPVWHDGGSLASSSTNEAEFDLSVTIFPALDGVADAAPLIFLDGGPGEVAFAPNTGARDPLDAWLHLADVLGTDRDFILMEQRGVGFSEPDLDCPEMEAVAEMAPADRQAIVEAEVQAAAECRERLVDAMPVASDLEAITTVQSAADVIALADALDVPEFALLAVSYGTRVGLEVLRRAPERVSAAVMDSVYPPEVNWYEASAELYRTAFDRVFTACAHEAECRIFFPDLRERFLSMVEDLRSTPVEVRIVDEKSGAPVSEIRLDDIAVLDAVFSMLYDFETIAGLPSFLDMAASGEPQILAEYAVYPFLGSASSAEGQYLSIECRESVLSADPETVRERAKDGGVFGRFALVHWDHMRAICDVWSLPAIAPAEAVTTDVPILILAGRFDPVTPVVWARRTAERLPNATLLVLANASHSVISSQACALDAAAAFLAGNELTGAQSDCFDDDAAFEFVTDRYFLP